MDPRDDLWRKMVTVIAKSNSRTKGLLSSIAEVSAIVSMLVVLSGCVSLDLFGGDKVDRSLSTASVPNQPNNSPQTDDATIRNAVTSADLTKLAEQPATGQCRNRQRRCRHHHSRRQVQRFRLPRFQDDTPLFRRCGELCRTGLPVGNRRMVTHPLRTEINCLPRRAELIRPHGGAHSP